MKTALLITLGVVLYLLLGALLTAIFDRLLRNESDDSELLMGVISWPITLLVIIIFFVPKLLYSVILDFIYEIFPED